VEERELRVGKVVKLRFLKDPATQKGGDRGNGRRAQYTEGDHKGGTFDHTETTPSSKRAMGTLTTRKKRESLEKKRARRLKRKMHIFDVFTEVRRAENKTLPPGVGGESQINSRKKEQRGGGPIRDKVRLHLWRKMKRFGD